LITQKNKSTKKNNFEEELRNKCKGLYYISETDAEISPFFGGKANGGPSETIARELGLKKETAVEERSFVDFFARPTKIQDWFTEIETKKAKRFLALQKLLEENLEDLIVLRTGRIQIDIYVVGLDAAGNLAGIQTKAVET
jgi:Nuclease A inhibitor-like protein